MKIIPAIDIIEGKCVRLTKGDYNSKKIYNQNPLEVAKEFEEFGIKYLHLVDLDGAKAKQVVNLKVLETIATKTDLAIDFGGGIKREIDLIDSFNAGAQQVTVGSLAAKNQDLFLEWLSKFGAEKLILGADAKDRKIATMGWQTATELDVVEFISTYQTKGIKTVICTDIDKDGMLQGAAVDLYKEIIESISIDLIASGGVSSMADLEELATIGCAGAIIGKAIYEGNISLKELSTFINE